MYYRAPYDMTFFRKLTSPIGVVFILLSSLSTSVRLVFYSLTFLSIMIDRDTGVFVGFILGIKSTQAMTGIIKGMKLMYYFWQCAVYAHTRCDEFDSFGGFFKTASVLILQLQVYLIYFYLPQTHTLDEKALEHEGAQLPMHGGHPYSVKKRSLVASGLRWRSIGIDKPKIGRELHNEQLAKALERRPPSLGLISMLIDFFISPVVRCVRSPVASAPSAAATEFTQMEWDAFRVKNLRMDCYILSLGEYYRPCPYTVQNEYGHLAQEKLRPFMLWDLCALIACLGICMVALVDLWQVDELAVWKVRITFEVRLLPHR